jgi:Tfp pilus assembly protein FimT
MKNEGYTVTELVVVVTLIGIITVIGASIGSRVFKSAKMATITNRLISDINFAKMLASRESKFIAITFENEGTSYRVRKQKDFGDLVNFEDVKRVRPLEGEVFFRIADVNSFAVNSTGEIFSYSESGGVSGDPTQIKLTLIIKKSKTGDDSTTNVALHKKLLLYPYGGVKIEK